MKLNFQTRLVLSFVVIFALFAAGVVLFERHRVKSYKTEALENRLDAYTGEVERFLSLHRGLSVSPDSLIELMPRELRVTLIDRTGRVVYDNALYIASMDNHGGRPEIVAASAEGSGTDIRVSRSAGIPYLYYAKDSGGELVVRVALPYDVKVRSLLKPDNVFLWVVIVLFVVGFVFIYFVGRYFGEAVKRLREREAREKTRRLKHEMTGNIAHELRTPVTSIRGFLEIVLGNELDETKRRGYLERAYSQTQTLSELISDMSLLARIDEKQSAFEFTDVDVTQLIEKVRSDASEALAEKQIAFENGVPEGLIVKGNESLLYSVFRNLTDNVIAHAGKGVSIRVEATPAGSGTVRFVFADTGRGISDERHLERLFERFYRVGEGRTRDTGGSGLGLSIVKNTVALHGGEIAVRNNAPSGLEFTFTLPTK